MGDLVNLRTERKRHDRAAREAAAAANRAKHGRTREEKGTTLADAMRAHAVLDGAKRDD